MIRETGVDGVTVARGAIGNPWIFQECRALWSGRPLPDPPSIARQRQAIETHWADIVAAYGEGIASRIIRKFGIKYAEHHPRHLDVRGAFVAVSKSEDFLALLDRWYAPSVDWPPVRRRTNHGDLVAAGARV